MFSTFSTIFVTVPRSAVDRCLADLLDVDWDVLTRQVIKGALALVFFGFYDVWCRKL